MAISKTFIAVLIVLIAVLSWVGNFTYLSIYYDWYDAMLHFLGGAWVAAAFLYFFSSRPQLFDVRSNYWLTLIFAVSFTVAVGVGWEFFEYAIFGDYLSLADTLADLALDMAGAAVLALIWRVTDKRV